MTPPSLARAVASAELTLSPTPMTPSAAAVELLERLVIESHRATEALTSGDMRGLHELLDVRAEMIGALEDITKIVAHRAGPLRLHSAQTEATRAALLAKTGELQQLNVRLLHCVRAEAARLSVAIGALDRGETSEVAYKRPQSERTPNLDLMR
jgi:hypothetical protein